MKEISIVPSSSNTEIIKETVDMQTIESEKNSENSLHQGSAIHQHPQGLFTDQKGNLKVVNLAVRYPFLIFFLILAITLVTSFFLVTIVFKAGNPFAEPGSEYDIYDIRSTAYDSFRLAQKEIEKKLAIANTLTLSNEKKDRVQEAYLDVTYWVFESEQKNGVFSSAESISAMKEALDLFTEHKDYESFCWKIYFDIPFTNSTLSQCRAPLSAIAMYYASSWDTEKVDNVIDQLTNPDNVDIYNDLSLCLEYGYYCELVPEGLLTNENKLWFLAVNNNITSILSKFDGKGELNSNNIDQMTLFAMHLMKLNAKRGIVDFYFDKNFTAENPVSMYSRAIISWGGPLNVTSGNLDNDDESNRDILKQ